MVITLEKLLIADDSGKLEKKQCFNNKIQKINNVKRKSIVNNLVQIFEGTTVALQKENLVHLFLSQEILMEN